MINNIHDECDVAHTAILFIKNIMAWVMILTCGGLMLWV